MEVLQNIPMKFDVGSLLERLHLDNNSILVRELERLVDTVEESVHPKALYREAFIESKGFDTVAIDGITFKSRMLRVNLDKAERVFPYVATCGTELDQIGIPTDDFLKRFWLDELRQIALERMVEYLDNHLAEKYALVKASSMNPGAGDVDVWAIEQQRELFNLVGSVTETIGVVLTDSFLMIPNKSVSGIRFPTEIDFRSCQVCRRAQCRHRIAPFDKKLWHLVESGGAP